MGTDEKKIIGVIVRDSIDNKSIKRFIKEGETLTQLLKAIEHDCFQKLVSYIYQ